MDPLMPSRDSVASIMIAHAACQVAAKQMVGIYLSVWVRRPMLQHIRGVQVTSIGTGIMGYLGNKGAVECSIADAYWWFLSRAKSTGFLHHVMKALLDRKQILCMHDQCLHEHVRIRRHQTMLHLSHLSRGCAKHVQ